MSELSTMNYQRGIADVTRDIRIKTGQFLMDAMEIGRLLFEAKAMVEPGKWSKYVEEELPFSHSWANNYMRLYKELGGDQLSIFGNSQALANLRPTQALELLALPAEQRDEFVQNHDVENMSTRELHNEIRKELEQAQAELKDVKDQLEDAQNEAEDLRADLEKAQSDAESRELEAKTYSSLASKAEKDRQNAEKSEKTALDLADKLKKQLSAAEANEKKAKEDLKKAMENPQIPDAVMEQMRREVEEEAARKATEDLRKQLEAAQKAAEDAAQAREKAEAALAAAQKQIKMADPDIIAYQAISKKFMKDYEIMDDRRKEIATANPDAGQRLKQFQIAMLTQWLEALKA